EDVGPAFRHASIATTIGANHANTRNDCVVNDIIINTTTSIRRPIDDTFKSRSSSTMDNAKSTQERAYVTVVRAKRAWLSGTSAVSSAAQNASCAGQLVTRRMIVWISGASAQNSNSSVVVQKRGSATVTKGFTTGYISRPPISL